MIAIDASAMLALLFREEGHEQVAAVLGDSCMSAVNLAEVIGRFTRDGHDGELVRRRIEASPVEIVPFERRGAAVLASLIPATLHQGLCLGDRACLALALERAIPALTADRAWLEVRVGVAVQCIR